ncbi:hypothetical protein THICB1_140060 [Thiomonas arsenitoxydans]|uniref:Uncharacterized protein n=1 Tax=Thiomonas arsenitoxydans (strain DSM 22701 / CIP 110005 / 3As) TaxID=426114 RepID=A0ABP1Z0Y3_THIA3|nr:hypothetical protein THICB1_140060 [Thiomonas arsenitoxydans]
MATELDRTERPRSGHGRAGLSGGHGLVAPATRTDRRPTLDHLHAEREGEAVSNIYLDRLRSISGKPPVQELSKVSKGAFGSFGSARTTRILVDRGWFA